VERDTAARGAGARTHALVSLGAALFTVAGAYGFGDVASANVDPARIAAQVATGVGFIGAGAIIRNGTSVPRSDDRRRALAGGIARRSVCRRWLPRGVGDDRPGPGRPGPATGGEAADPAVRSFGTIVEVEYLRGHGTLGPLLRAWTRSTAGFIRSSSTTAAPLRLSSGEAG
jgi:MgtC family